MSTLAPTKPIVGPVSGSPNSRSRKWAPRLPPGRGKVYLVRIAAAAALVGLWQIAPNSVLPADAFGRPGDVASNLWDLLRTAQLFPQLGTTALGVVYGMLIGAPLGTVLALAMSIRPVRFILDPIVTMAYAVPKLGLISLFVLVLGENAKPHIALIVASIMFIYFYSTRQAIREIDESKITAMRLMGASRFKVLRSLIIRSAVPQLIGATRLALPLAFATEIFGEISVPAAGSGLGVLLSKFENVVNASGSVAVMIIAALIGYILDVIVGGRLRRYTQSTGLGIR